MGDPTSSTVLDEAERKAVFFQCPEGKAFISGEEGQLSQCRQGTWTPVLDKCDQDCPVIRDCEAVYELGFNTSGNYRIVPSGEKQGDSVEVFCLMEQDRPKSVWTEVLGHDRAQTSVTVTEDRFGTPGSTFFI
ncbi:uncharacterized protein LOC122244698, partial [Penaeus japonicus]|uniref:uncharacterized protein LOC122244698 n=1 Tax=Penaeus japonicus TaxID=27405 RepID=UPI001C7103DC